MTDPSPLPPVPATAPAPLLSEVVAALDALYDPRRADDWDRVGTVCGDPDQPVRRVLVAVDPTLAVVGEAVDLGADLLLTHHPLLLRGVHGVAATTPKGRAVHTLVTNGVALHTCHTNADSPPGGVSDTLARLLGLTDVRPLDPDEPLEGVDDVPVALDHLSVLVPTDAVDAVVAALGDAGAGAVGDYDRAHFRSAGTGMFRPLPGSSPALGRVGELTSVEEVRVETVLPRTARRAVLDALARSHPYEQPAHDLHPVATVAPAPTSGSGRIGRLSSPEPLDAFVDRVLAVLPASRSVARVAGDPARTVATVALCGGAGDFLLDHARQQGADVYLTSDLRHHPVSELLEHPDAPAVVDVPHWAAEATWVPVAAAALRAWAAAAGSTVEVLESEVVTDPWTDVRGWPADRR